MDEADGTQHRLVTLGWRFGLAAASVGTALAITLSLQPTVFPTPLFFAAVVVSTWFGGTWPGLFSVLIATALLEYFFVSQERSLAVDLQDLLYLANLSDLKTLGRKAACIGLIGTLIPILAGVGLVYAIPRDFWGPTVQAHYFSFALFVGMNLANSTNPVLARILMDLGLLNKEIGTLCMTATIVDDLVNWTIFAIILSDMVPFSPGATSSLPLSILMVALVFVLILGGGRLIGPQALRWVKGHVAWPSGFIAVTTLAVLVVAGVTERIGIHSFLGAFLVGAALGGQSKEHEEAHDAITTFALSFFAPIYFVSMGMTTNFITNFDLPLARIIHEGRNKSASECV